MDEFIQAKTRRAVAEISRWTKMKMTPTEFDRFKTKRLVELTIQLAKPEDQPE